MEDKDNVKEEKVYTQKEVEDIIAQVNKQAAAQCENLAKRCQFLQEQLMYKRLDYLFKLVENGTFDNDFTLQCKKEI